VHKFRDRLTRELEQRREANPRYSLRAFARFLTTDHSTLSQVIRGKRAIPTGQLRLWAKKLGLDPEEAAAWVAAEHLPEPADAERERQLRHWTTEAVAIASDSTHWELIRIARTPNLQPDCRRVATELGVTPDRVNMAFSRLLGLRLMTTSADGRWQDITDPPVKTERQFLRLALSQGSGRRPPLTASNFHH